MDVLIRIHSLSGVPSALLLKRKLQDFSVQCDLNKTSQKTRCTNGILKWILPEAEISSLKSKNPMIKLNIHHQAEVLGYILVDIRDMLRRLNQKTYKVNSMLGAELSISASIMAPLSVQESTDNISTIELVDHEIDPMDEEQEIKYAITFSLDDFLDTQNLCTTLSKPNETTDYWLSWTLFNVLFQSEPFSVASLPKRSSDVVKVKTTASGLAASLDKAFPLKMYLCTSGNIVAACEVSPPIESLAVLPFSTSAWCSIMPLDAVLQGHSASVKIRLDVELAEKPPETPPAAPVTPQEDTAAYEEDAFEEEAPPEPLSAPAPSPLPDNSLRHFRMTVIVRSISAMKRSSHAFIQFVYPHLGSKTPVRSHPLWIPAHSETELDNASVTYDTVLASASLRSVAMEHPLVINIKSKSHLGNEDIGCVEVDFSSVVEDAPHSFRCPVTKKSFRTMDDFIAHRNAIALLNATGKTTMLCPTHPIEVHALDCYYDIRDTNTRQLSADGGKVRVVLVLENLGVVGYEVGVPVKPGYQMQQGGLYQVEGEGESVPVEVMGTGSEEAALHRDPEMASADTARQVETMKLDWENWRREAESKWREELRQKEMALRKSLEEENQLQLSARADDLRRAQEEAGRLEVRLRSTIDAVDKQKVQLALKEDQMNMKLAQKSSELQLLERRIREEARGKVDAETRRAEGLEKQVENLKDALMRMEKRAKDAERDFESYRQQIRSMPETQLREEVAKLRAQLAETRGEIERERRVGVERELEKEHFRAQMHRLALALKRERERSSVVARQELEQLRLEFLAREERYVLDGDRDELRTIRQELSQLRSSTAPSHERPKQAPVSNNGKSEAVSRLEKKKSDLLKSGLYDEDKDPIIAEINRSIRLAEESMIKN